MRGRIREERSERTVLLLPICISLMGATLLHISLLGKRNAASLPSISMVLGTGAACERAKKKDAASRRLVREKMLGEVWDIIFRSCLDLMGD